MDSSEEKFIEELNYCIKVIQSNKLYELDFDEQGGGNKDVINLF